MLLSSASPPLLLLNLPFPPAADSLTGTRSVSLFKALLSGQGNLSDSEKHSRKTLTPADQGDTLFSTAWPPPSPPAWHHPLPFRPEMRTKWMSIELNRIIWLTWILISFPFFYNPLITLSNLDSSSHEFDEAFEPGCMFNKWYSFMCY